MTTNERNQDRTGQLSTHNIFFNKQLSQWHCFCRRNWGLAWVVLGLVVAVAYRPLVFSSLCRRFPFWMPPLRRCIRQIRPDHTWWWFCYRSTDFDKIWQDDVYWLHSADRRWNFKFLKIQDGGGRYLNKKLSYRRVTTRCVLSEVILPIATQQCRNYL